MSDMQRGIVNARQRRVGATLRNLRVEAGYTLADAADAVEISQSKLSRMETGVRSPQYDDTAALLMFYRTGRQLREELLSTLREANRPSWLQQYELDLPEYIQSWIDYEDGATAIRNYEILVIPGLLQTRSYARAVLANGGQPLTQKQIDDRVEARMARRHILDRKKCPDLQVVIHEIALRQRFGGVTVMREQLRHLLRMADRPSITVRVVPLISDTHPGGDGSFVILDQPELSLVMLEGKVSTAYLERDNQVDIYRMAFDNLLTVAWDEQRSAELIEGIIAELPSERTSP